MRSFTLSLVAIAALGACQTARHSPEEIRLHCLSYAHKTVKVPENDSSNRREMVREVYLRCLDSYGVPDAPPRAGSE